MQKDFADGIDPRWVAASYALAVLYGGWAAAASIPGRGEGPGMLLFYFFIAPVAFFLALMAAAVLLCLVARFCPGLWPRLAVFGGAGAFVVAGFGRPPWWLLVAAGALGTRVYLYYRRRAQDARDLARF